MPGVIGKFDNFILDGRAVTYAHSRNFTTVKRGPIEIFSDNFMSFRICVANVADDFIHEFFLSPE